MMEEIEYEDGTSKIEPLSRKGRGRKLMDQKANSVADIASILGSIGGPLGDGVGLRVEGKRGRCEEEKTISGERKEVVERKWVPGEEKSVVVEVRWKDLLDAEFARTWSENVIHDVLEGGSVESTYGEAVKAAEDARAAREENKRLVALEVAGDKKTPEQVTL
jgi:hypothetical protein